MKKLTFTLISFAISFTPLFAAAKAIHVNTPQGEIIIPDEQLDLVVLKPQKKLANGLPGGETPASIACIYGLTPSVPGCPINGTSALPTGGWGAIAVLEKGDDPDAESNLNVFSQAFGLPPCTTSNGCFQVAYVGGVVPPPAKTSEHDLDIEWAHAMAPHAKIIMVEGLDLQFPYITQSIQLANQLVAANGGGEISMSTSQPEFSGETQYDSYFTSPGIVYFASSGDYSAPARYPASSPNVVACGGTQLIRDKNGNFVQEIGWRDTSIPSGTKLSGGSGGPSLYEPRPSYQTIVQKVVGNARGTPDIAFEASIASGVDVYAQAFGGWIITGGTSLAAPALAGIVNSANTRATSSKQELTMIYADFAHDYHTYWHDVIQGNNGFPCLSGYDFDTGLGTPSGYKGK